MDAHSPSVYCFGEALVDGFVGNHTNGKEQEHSGAIEYTLGGAPTNTAAGLAKLGVNVSLIAEVGDDEYGKSIRNELVEHGVHIEHVLVNESEPTTRAMVTLGPSGARSFDFFRGAHEKITPRDVSLPNETFLLHFGSIMQIGETGAQATQKLISQAKKHGTILSYDPNIREKLWENLNRARDVILATAKEVDILKISEEEAHILSPDTTFEEAAQQLCTDNLEILIITRGREGCYFMTKKFNGYLPTISVDAVDTTGAGDAFNAGFIYQLLRTKKRVSELTRKELEQKLRFAEVVGSLTTTKKGALTAFPTIHEIYMYTDFIQNIQPT